MTLQEVKQIILKSELPTKQDLLSIPLSTLRNLDIRTPEQANLVQEVFDEKMSQLPPENAVNINDILIKMDREKRMTPELEAKYQKQIDERLAKVAIVPKIDTDIKKASKELETIKEEIKAIVVNEVKTDVKKPFCSQCSSRGIRHLKTCPTLKK